MADSTKAQIGSRTTLSYFNTAVSPAVWATIGNVKSFGDIGSDRPEVDSTDLDSLAVERIGGLPDGKEVSITAMGNSTTMALFETLYNSGATVDFRETFPAPLSTSRYFSLFPLGNSQSTITPSGLVEVTLRGRITGAIVTAPTHV